MSLKNPLIVEKTVTYYIYRNTLNVISQDKDEIYYALAANCVHNVNYKQFKRRTSLTDDKNKIKRAIRLLITLDKK